MRVRPWSIAAAALAVVAVFSGCAGTRPLKVANPLEAEPERPLTDVPVPVGFIYRTKDSYILKGNYRVARLVYVGSSAVDRVAAFYEEQMPLSRWKLKRDFGVTERVLTFESEHEECSVRVQRRQGLTFLDVEIAPRRG